ncbi:hypothetical protein EDB19DRAFT_1827580 [Suillus lakei]|nr:hypothetical protein EDB19DRAFT_1827580 [Suillus lakei]
MSLPCMWCLDRNTWHEMLYKGNKIHIDHLGQMFALTEEQMVELWENKVLVGLSTHVSYQEIIDDGTNHNVGYSFLSDHRNPCFADRDHFLKALISKEELFGCFAITRSQCNLVMLGKNLMMLRTYHKSGMLSKMDKLILHSIDGVTANFIIQDLALTRPFAEVAVHVCYPDKPSIKEMYQMFIFVNNHKPFNTDQLTVTMSRVSIFKCKLSHFVEDLLEEDEQDTVEALQAGHKRSTENWVYSLSPDALTGAPEDLLPLFLQASTNWQLVIHAIPGGLQLVYTHARSHQFKQLAESGRFGSDFQRTNSPAGAAIAPLPEKSLWTLRMLLKDEQVNWQSSKQKDAVVSVLKRETDVITMLKTGGGKSMLAIISAIMDIKKVVVVVLPLKSLMTDWERKLMAMGIGFQVYIPTVQLFKDINLIRVSVDREKFNMWKLVLLSGMVPPSSIGALKKAFGLAENAIEIRELSNWPELEYIMKTPAVSNTQESMGWAPEDRGLVFITYMEDGESLANKSGWPFYNGSKEMSDTSRVQCYRDWFTGKSLVMICTSVFSMGNGYLHVQLVIHLKTPLEMTEMIQAQGRGGRDGQLARCYILPSSTPPKITIGRSEVDYKGLLIKPPVLASRTLAHQQSISVKKCTIDQVSDPSDPFAKVYKQTKKSRTNRLEGVMKQVERMRKALDKLKDRGCPHALLIWKASILYCNHKGICWKCHVPTCGDELHALLERGQMKCACQRVGAGLLWSATQTFGFKPLDGNPNMWQYMIDVGHVKRGVW